MNLIAARKLLRVGVLATTDEVVRAYRRRIYEVHPDRNPDDPKAAEKVIKLTEAYRLVRRAVESPEKPAGQRTRGRAWEWIHADDATAAGDPNYKPGTDPLTDLVNDLRRVVRNMDPDKVAYGAAAAAIGVLIVSEMLRGD